MDFKDFNNKNRIQRKQFKQRPMNAESSDEFTYAIIFVVLIAFLLVIYSQKKYVIEDVFDSAVEVVEKINKTTSSNAKSSERLESGEYADGYKRINFVNNSKQTRKVYWYKGNGDKKLYKTLGNNESYEQRTHPHHRWLITDKNGKELGFFNTKGNKSFVTMYRDKIEQTKEGEVAYSSDGSDVSSKKGGAVREPHENHEDIKSDKSNFANEELESDNEQNVESISSIEAKVVTSINFTNSTDDLVRVYWIDYKGKRVFYKVLQAGKSYLQPTYITHPWVVTDRNENELGVYYPERQRLNVIIGGDDVQKLEASKETQQERRSLKNDQRVEIYIVNKSNQTRKIYWLNHMGRKIYKTSLQPEEGSPQITYVTHPWLITDVFENEVMLYHPKVGDRVVEID